MTYQVPNPKGKKPMQPIHPPTKFKVAIYSTVFVDARDKDEAEDIARDSLIGCLIKVRDFEVDAEAWED